jgi:predicted deacetylase
LINESCLEEGKSVRADGRPLSFAPNDTKVSLEAAVIEGLRRLEGDNLKLHTYVADRWSVSMDDRVQLTDIGLRTAAPHRAIGRR